MCLVVPRHSCSSGASDHGVRAAGECDGHMSSGGRSMSTGLLPRQK